MSKRSKLDESFTHNESEVEIEDEDCVLDDSFVEPPSSPTRISPSPAVNLDSDDDTRDSFANRQANFNFQRMPPTYDSDTSQHAMNQTCNLTASSSFALNESFCSPFKEELSTNVTQFEDFNQNQAPIPQETDTAPYYSDSESFCASSSGSIEGLNDDSDDSILMESDEEDYDLNLEEEILIYKDAPITVNDSLLAILSFALRHKLDGSALVHLLQLIALHCRKEESQFKSTLYFFKKHFSHLKAPVKPHYYCSICYASLPSKDSQCENILDKSHSHKKEQHSFFLEVCLKEQIKTLFERKGFFEDLQHRFTRVKSKLNNIEDIYDGQLYKEFASNFLSSKNKGNFSMILNTDGVPVFNYSKTSMYPVYFAINELPYQKRFNKSNMILGGIWYGKKPVANHILEPFVTSFKDLHSQGVEVTPYGSQENIVCRGMLLLATADLPAKADLMGLKHTGGSCSCTLCKIEGKSVQIKDTEHKNSKTTKSAKTAESKGTTDQEKLHKEKKKYAFVFPYDKNLELRRHIETESFARQAIETGKEVCGVKWPTYLSKIMPDMIRGMGVDDLHGCWHGVCRKLLKLWTSPTYMREPWSLYEKIPLIEERLQHITLPNFVQGLPVFRKMTEWKGKDVKTFFLYLALPVLEGLLPTTYFDNLIDFISSIYILNSESIEPNDLLACSKRLERFVRQFQELYSERHMTINVHYCLHLTFVVTNLGPLRCYSCFVFESLNGELLQMIHGTRFVEMQLANCVFMVISLPNELRSVKSEDVRKYTSSLHHSHQRVRILEEICPGTFAAGNYMPLSKISADVIVALRAFSLEPSECCFFSKVKRGSSIFVAQCYTRSAKTFSSLVCYSNKQYGIVAAFVESKSSFFAAIRPVNVRSFCNEGPSKNIGHIRRYVVTDKVDFVDVCELRYICFSVCVSDYDPFLCERVNWMEVE